MLLVCFGFAVVCSVDVDLVWVVDCFVGLWVGVYCVWFRCLILIVFGGL